MLLSYSSFQNDHMFEVSQVQLPVICGRQCTTADVFVSWILQSSALSSTMFTRLRNSVCAADMPVVDGHPSQLLFSSVWPFMGCHERINIIQQTASLMNGKSYNLHEHKDRHFESSSEFYWFRKISVVNSPLRVHELIIHIQLVVFIAPVIIFSLLSEP